MKKTFYVRIDPSHGCPVTVSDEPWTGDLAVTDWTAVTPERITAAARRRLSLPLYIAETERLFLRELTEEDHPLVLKLLREDAGKAEADRPAGSAGNERPEGDPDGAGPGEARLRDPETFRAYVGNQYRFYEYGLWGVFRKTDEAFLGLCGFGPDEEDGVPELGYHIAAGERGKGYAFEAALAALRYLSSEAGAEEARVTVRQENLPSVRLAEKLEKALEETAGTPAGDIPGETAGEGPEEASGYPALIIRILAPGNLP